jgi:hypothetical protein
MPDLYRADQRPFSEGTLDNSAPRLTTRLLGSNGTRATRMCDSPRRVRICSPDLLVLRTPFGLGIMKRTPSKNWSEAELSRLKAMIRRKVDARQIAIALGRHVGSVKSKVRQLGLVPRKNVR